MGRGGSVGRVVRVGRVGRMGRVGKCVPNFFAETKHMDRIIETRVYEIELMKYGVEANNFN